ncbi:hypothetical protein GGF41_001865, partial [Coemansia sp. RSA 2531]
MKADSIWTRVVVVAVLVQSISAVQHQLFASDTGDDSVSVCLKHCTTAKCRERCFGKQRLSDEAVLKRTQRCNQECHSEPEELIHMCIQRCSLYMVDPVAHNIDVQEAVTVDGSGMLVANEHLRTRIRLIGPDGLPLKATGAAVATVLSIPTQPNSDRTTDNGSDDSSWD